MSLAQIVALRPGSGLDGQIAATVCGPRAHVFAGGHRLVVAVAGSAAPLYAPNPGHGGDQWSDERLVTTRSTVRGGTVVLPVVT